MTTATVKRTISHTSIHGASDSFSAHVVSDETGAVQAWVNIGWPSVVTVHVPRDREGQVAFVQSMLDTAYDLVRDLDLADDLDMMR